jgi:hypothetical protein
MKLIYEKNGKKPKYCSDFDLPRKTKIIINKEVM